jgi:glycosyltransferase involved in cell wall biosynthesis
MQELTQEHPNVRLVCIGDGQLHKLLADQILDTGLQNNMFLTGSIHEAGRLLKAADIFVLPSKSESYGYVLHEAGLARVPIVASNVGGITDIITNDSLGTLLNTTNAQPLIDALEDFLNNPQTYQHKADALAATLQNRTVAAMTSQTTAIYETDSSTATSST